MAPTIWVLTGSTTEKSAHSKTHGITTWGFPRVFECGASWTAVPLYLPPKAVLSVSVPVQAGAQIEMAMTKLEREVGDAGGVLRASGADAGGLGNKDGKGNDEDSEIGDAGGGVLRASGADTDGLANKDGQPWPPCAPHPRLCSRLAAT
jgi:hypothetical protein